MDQNAPWWVCLIFSVGLLQHHHHLSADVDHPAQLARRLQAINPIDDMLNSTNPILPIPCISDFISPCGNVSVPEEGLNISTPFGTYHIDGAGSLKPEVEGMDHAFSKYTVLFCAAAAALWAALTVMIQSKREAFLTKVKSTLKGNLDEGGEDGFPAEHPLHEAPDLSVESNTFIAPGNIYRVLAVCPPGTPGISFSRWLGWAMKAFICAYMQLYLPYGFLKDIFSEWQFDGIKSPIWFGANAGSFFTMFASLSAICSLFASKCGENIRRGAKANFYILTHEVPKAEAKAIVDLAEDEVKGTVLGSTLVKDVEAVVSAGEDKATAAMRQGEAAVSKVEDGAKKVPGAAALVSSAEDRVASAKDGMTASLLQKETEGKTKLEQFLIKHLIFTLKINEYFWCTFSMIMSIAMSVLLQLVMFLKVATFTGATEGAAVVTLSLYFVIDLDEKVFESHPKLRPVYRKQVAAQTEKRLCADGVTEYKPKWLNKIASVSLALLNSSVTLGLFAIILCAWKNRSTGLTIGGDPFGH